MVNLGTWNMEGRDMFEVDTYPIWLTGNWELSAVLIGEAYGTRFLEKNLLESAIIWLQQPESKN